MKVANERRMTAGWLASEELDRRWPEQQDGVTFYTARPSLVYGE